MWYASSGKRMPINNQPQKKKENSPIMRSGIFSFESNPGARFILDYKRLEEVVQCLRLLGQKIVLTSGSFDMIHIGHARYVEHAKRCGDFLIVGVDSDEKIQERKGPDRPIVPEEERVEMLTHLRCVDIVTIKPAKAKKWELIKLVRPDVLIATKETYSADELKALKEFVGEVMVLEPQAETTTSAKIRRLHIGALSNLGEVLTPKIVEVITGTIEAAKNNGGLKKPAVDKIVPHNGNGKKLVVKAGGRGSRNGK